jgi:Vitamin K-dependent gamma-carboxylase
MSALPLALLRIVTGSLTLVWAVLLYFDVDPLLTYLRVEPDQDILWWQLLPGLPASAVKVLCLLLVVMSFLLMSGLWSRISAWGVFFLTLALQRYNPLAFNGGDLILRGVLQLGVALGPSGACLSLDSLLRGGRNKPIPLVEAWPIRFVQLHISIGYLLTFYLKTRGDTWFDGTALWYALNLDDLARFDVPQVLVTHPLGTVFTLLAVLTEAFVGLGVWWHRTRPLALLAGIALHAGIALVMEIGFFSIVMVTSYIAFVPSSAIEGLLSRFSPRAVAAKARPLDLPATGSVTTRGLSASAAAPKPTSASNLD